MKVLITRPPRVGYPKPGCTIYTSFRGVLVSVFFYLVRDSETECIKEVLLRMAQKKQKEINKHKRPLLELEIKCNCKEVSPLASALTPKLRRTQPYPTAHRPRPTARSPRPHAPVGTARAALRERYHTEILRLWLTTRTLSLTL